MSLSQILAAMMQSSGQAPQVTPMGAAPSGGGGGGGGVKPVTGGAIKMPSVGQTERPPPPTMEGIVTEYGLDPASQPDIYGLNAPDTTPLARQMFEATEELYRLNNPAGFGDWWDAQRGGTEKARERHAQAQQNIVSFKQHQAYIANEQAKAAAENQARTTAALVAPALGQEQADAIYNAVRSNPELQGKIVEKFFQRTDPVNLEKQVNYVMGLPEGSPQKDLAMQVLLKNNGTQLEVSKDGTIRLATGGELPVSPARSTTQDNMVFADQDDITKSVQSIHSIANDFDEEFLRPISQLKGALGRTADKWDIPDSFIDSATGEPNIKRWGAEQKAFTRKAARRVFMHRKMITGVAGGEKEMQKIEESLANAMIDSPITFQISLQSELDDTYDQLNMKRIQAGLPPYDFSGMEYKLFPELYAPQEQEAVQKPALGDLYTRPEDM